MRRNCIQCSSKHRYTIVEMMVVVAIFIIILAMAMGAWLNSGSEAKLKRAVRLVNNQLNLARSLAIRERTEVGVYFYFDASKNQKCGIFYYNGTTRGKAVPNEPELFFPSGTVATSVAMPKQSANFNVSTAATANMYLSFNAKGQVSKSGLFSTGTGSNTYHDPLRSIWITSVNKQKNNTLAVTADEAYYEVAVNTFNGRTKTTYHEVNN